MSLRSLLHQRFHRRMTLATVAVLLGAVGLSTVWAQLPVPRPRPRPAGGNNQPQQPALPNDPKLLELHKEFVLGAEKLAQEYERDKDFEKAKVVYQAILKLVPNYPKAEQGLQEAKQAQISVDKKVLDIQANREWQPTGVLLSEGMPVRIDTAGQWVFRIEFTGNAAGIEIPKEYRDFNLGALVGVIDTGNPKDAKPFLIGESKEFTAERSGQLWLRMYDFNAADNSGKISVQIQSTFLKK